MLATSLVSVLIVFHLSGVDAFTVTTNNANVKVRENQGADLSCSYSADFGANARVEWKFLDMKGAEDQVYVVFDGKPTTTYADRVTKFDERIRFSKVTRKDNGEYDCEVSGNGKFGKVNVKLTVLVPPSVPMCRIPSSVTTGRAAILTCRDGDASPPPTYKWYKGKIPLPVDPKQFPDFKNATYKMNPATGSLEFPAVTKMDTGDYYCEASNEAGAAQRCQAKRMEVRDVNTGGIVAGVIVALLALALLGFGLWYANRKGYLPKKIEKKPKASVVYQPTSDYGDEEDSQGGEFRQKSSFVV